MNDQNRTPAISFQFFRIAFLSLLTLTILFFFLTSKAHSAQATLAWEPNTESDIAGYRLNYGFERGNYLYSIDVGNQASYTCLNLEPNRVHYFAVTAYDIDDNESDFSEEITYLVPADNMSPMADAGPDQSIDEGITATLNGSNSTDPNNDIVAYFWEQISGPEVQLLTPADSTTTFTTPDVGGDGSSLTFLLTVTDKNGSWSQDTCIVNVCWINLPPTASAGDDQLVNEGDTVTMSAFGSSDPDDGIAYYVWEQIDGPTVNLSDQEDIQPDFTTQNLGAGDFSLTFQLTVEDYGGLRSTDTCIVNVSKTNSPPVAQAGEDQVSTEGEMVSLDGSSSWDQDDGIVATRWTQTGGTPVTFSDPTAKKTTFTIPTDASSNPMTFQISVTDKGGLTSTETCAVIVADATVYEDAEDSETYGWSVYDNKPENATIRNVFDEQRQSRVIQLNGSGIDNGYELKNEDGSAWGNSEQFTIQWSMQYEENFIVYLDVETSAGHRYLFYTPEDYNDLGEGEYIHHGLGSNVLDGQWHIFTRDLQADLQEAQSGVDLVEVNGFFIRGSGRVDKIQLIDSVPSRTTYEDGENGDVEGWHIYDNDPSGAAITNIFDEDRQSRVIELKGAGTKNGYRFSNDLEEAWAKWDNREQFVIQWSMKYSEKFVVYVEIDTDDGRRFLYYKPDDANYLGDKDVHHGLGSNSMNGQWHTFTRDLTSDLKDAQPDVKILAVNGFLIRGSGKVDDIHLNAN